MIKSLFWNIVFVIPLYIKVTFHGIIEIVNILLMDVYLGRTPRFKSLELRTERYQ